MKRRASPGSVRSKSALNLGRVALVLAGLVGGSAVLAQSIAAYDLSWSTADGGGGSFSTGDSYSLDGTAGQPDAGLMTGGGVYSLAGGFWGGGAVTEPGEKLLHLPLAMRSH